MSETIVNIGMMSFAHMHASSYAVCVNDMPEARLAGIADEDPARGKQMAARFDTRSFGSYEDLLGAGIDAVIVCSENSKHRRLVELAASAGKHVLCEKPLSTTLEDGLAMIDTCRAKGVKLMTAFPVRYAPPMIDVKGMVMTGQLGDILAVSGTNRGKNPDGWFTDMTLAGGGAVMDHTVHVADVMRWITGAEITEVYAEIDNLIFGKDYDDMASLTLGFSSGVFGSIDPSWSRPKSFPFWGDVTLEVVGTNGVVGVDCFSSAMNLYSDKTGSHTYEYWGGSIDAGLIKSFVDSVANDTPVEITGEDGLAAVEVVLAAYESAKRKQPVKLPLN
ncbi:MAG: Gfo/Idh/MocA family oxidoreductase [Armatimonadota bacterium]|nr:Gfo/Idh/MocA family oxidoreductase [Armatimonadota bacterium]